MKFENCKEYCSLKNNKENIRKLMKEFECEASGRSNLIRPLVTDENGRFDEEKAEKLITELVEDMDRYGYTTGGTGLGLAIVKHIVARNNAQLDMDSEPGKGTDIKVTFDAYREDEQ